MNAQNLHGQPVFKPLPATQQDRVLGTTSLSTMIQASHAPIFLSTLVQYVNSIGRRDIHYEKN
jgi:hypothetical protein